MNNNDEIVVYFVPSIVNIFFVLFTKKEKKERELSGGDGTISQLDNNEWGQIL